VVLFGRPGIGVADQYTPTRIPIRIQHFKKVLFPDQYPKVQNATFPLEFCFTLNVLETADKKKR
jgi:hypothetical protein